MLGKIVDQGSIVVIYSPITKTSNSGLFSNKRLAILSLREGILGYQSKLPDSFNHFQDPSCINKCKESIRIRTQPNFVYFLNPNDHTTLVIKWQTDKQKSWEFKFQNGEIAQQWFQYIYKILNPTSMKPIQDQDSRNINFSKLKQRSRFSYPSPNHYESNIQEQNLSPIEESQKKGGLNAQEKTMIESDQPRHPLNRFRAFERQNNLAYESVNPAATLITTFRQKYPGDVIFRSVKKYEEQNDQNLGQNWNIMWYEAIETEQEQARINIYNNFLATCQKTCKEIIHDITILKTYRTHSPIKIARSQEVYIHNNITYHILLEKDIENSLDQLCSNFLYHEFRKLQENYTFILKATKNKGSVKVPLSCIFDYRGFTIFCEANVPSQFLQVDHSDLYIFHPQIQRLEQHLHIRINISQINLYTNKVSSITEQSKTKRNHYLIIKDVKRILPEVNHGGTNLLVLSKDYFLSSIDMYPKDYDFLQQKGKLVSKFMKNQSEVCTIITCQDLKQSFDKANLTFQSIPDIFVNCENKYLLNLLITELISQTFCHIVRTQMMILVKKWNSDLQTLLKDQPPDYEAYIFQLLSSLLSENAGTDVRLWNIISSQLFSKYSITIKMEDIIVGYLLSSIAFKIGIHLDYQLLILHKNHFFNTEILIPPQSIKSFQHIFTKYQNQDMCDSYQTMMNAIENHQDFETLEDAERFYKLRQQQSEFQLSPWHWKKIRKLFSFFIPYGNQQQYQYLQIYSSLRFLFMDYSNFCILVSAIKWLFHSRRVDEAIELVLYFKDNSWFWVSQVNPFIIILFQIVGEYFRVTGNLLSSVEYFIKCNQFITALSKSNVQQNNLDRDYKLAKIYMDCNRHKESLSKYLQIKKIYRKSDKQPNAVLDILVETSKLYLHLGDIENCFRSCKEAIQFSVLNPFISEEQQFQVYSLLLRSFEIREDSSKYKFYVDIIEQKFEHTENPIIFQNTLRLTMEGILQKYNKYRLKKCGFVLYYLERSVDLSDIDLTLIEEFNRLRKLIGNESPCKLLIHCMDSDLEISDMIMQRSLLSEKEGKGDQSESSIYQDLSRVQNLLKKYCSFIGYEFILGNIQANLAKCTTNF